MAKPFRFGVQVGGLPRDTWAEYVRAVEDMGYSSLLVPDHFGKQWDPFVLMTAAAAVTERLVVGSLVLDVDYRHPVTVAKAAASLDGLSGGRLELGIGAGWMVDDYEQAGIPYDPPGVRISRLEEALGVLKAMWTQDVAGFTGEHYTVTGITGARESVTVPHPRLTLGGGGPRMLALAGRHGDVVGVNASLHAGRTTPQTANDLTPARVRDKSAWARDGAAAAGRDPDTLEYQTLSFVVALVDDPAGIRQGVAAGTGMSEEDVADCPFFLVGSAAEVREQLQRRREEAGINYVVIQGTSRDDLARFAEAVVAPLAGT